MILYDFFMYQSEVLEMESSLMQIGSGYINPSLQKQILDALLDWSNQNWKVTLTKKPNIVPLKSKLTEDAYLTSEIKIIKSFFNDAKILDIWSKFF